MLLVQGAYTDGKRFHNWLKEKLRKQADNIYDVTFKQLFEKHNIYLAIVACDLNKQEKPFIFDKEEEPNTAVSFAVRASISIPGIFTIVSSKKGYHQFIDGGLMMNYPIKILNKKARETNAKLIGVRFNKPVKLYSKPNIVQILKGAYDSTMVNQDYRLPEDFKNNSTGRYIEILIDVGDISPLDFELSNENKNKLLQSGKRDAQLKILEATLNQLALSAKKRGEPSITNVIDPELQRALGWLDARKYIAQTQGMIVINQDYPHVDSRTAELFGQELEGYLYWIRQVILTQDVQKLGKPPTPQFMAPDAYINALDMLKDEVSQKMTGSSAQKLLELISYVQNRLRL